jgi:hypothetical protein
MDSSGKCDAVLNDVGPTICDGPNIGSLYLRIASSVNNTQSGYGTPIIVSGVNGVSEARISYDTIRQYGFNATLALSRWRRQLDRSGRLINYASGDA